VDEPQRERPIVVDSDGMIVGDVALDGAGAIAGDLPCRQCGYNLRGLRPHGQCPECAGAVGLSLRGDRLCFADPVWVRRLARGARWALWGLVGALSYYGALFVPILPKAIGYLWVFALLTTLASLRGAWLLTARESRTFGPPAATAIRRTVRIALAIDFVGQLIWTTRWLIGAGSAFSFLLIPIWFAVVVGEFAKLVVLERLARRLADAKLTRRFRFLRWAYPGAIMASTMLNVSMWLILGRGAGSASGWWTAYAATSGCTRSVRIAFGIVYVISLWRIGSALYAQARLAEINWGAGALPGVRVSNAH
jgi:hypothetical protein